MIEVHGHMGRTMHDDGNECKGNCRSESPGGGEKCVGLRSVD